MIIITLRDALKHLLVFLVVTLRGLTKEGRWKKGVES